MALTTIVDDDGDEHQIVRLNMPFGRVGAGEFGTYFIGYARSPDVIELMLTNMFIGRPAGTYDRILELDKGGRLLTNATELMRLVGDVKSELFHYEVRATYDTPEVAESRRIVQDAKKERDDTWQKSEWHPDKEKPPEW